MKNIAYRGRVERGGDRSKGQFGIRIRGNCHPPFPPNKSSRIFGRYDSVTKIIIQYPAQPTPTVNQKFANHAMSSSTMVTEQQEPEQEPIPSSCPSSPSTERVPSSASIVTPSSTVHRSSPVEDHNYDKDGTSSPSALAAEAQQQQQPKPDPVPSSSSRRRPDFVPSIIHPEQVESSSLVTSSSATTATTAAAAFVVGVTTSGTLTLPRPDGVISLQKPVVSSPSSSSSSSSSNNNEPQRRLDGSRTDDGGTDGYDMSLPEGWTTQDVDYLVDKIVDAFHERQKRNGKKWTPIETRCMVVGTIRHINYMHHPWRAIRDDFWDVFVGRRNDAIKDKFRNILNKGGIFGKDDKNNQPPSNDGNKKYYYAIVRDGSRKYFGGNVDYTCTPPRWF